MSGPIEPSMRDHAVALSERGYRVFKLWVNGKLPILSGWYDVATNDPDEVRWMWTDPATKEPLDNNIGILTGGDFFVLDVDTKNGAKGNESLEGLVEMTGLDLSTRQVVTPTGGRHFYYALPDGRDVRNTASKIAPGLDTRGHHGYVVAPPSMINERSYQWIDADRPLVPAPSWLLDLCTRRDKKKASRGIALVTLDQADAIECAREWLIDGAAEAVEGAGGNNTTFQVAAKIKDFGVSEPMALELMLEHWNEEKAFPPWDPEDLQKIVGNAYQYGQNPPGIASPLADFDPVELGPSVAAQVFNAAQRLPGEAGESYLRAHGIAWSDDVTEVLRYHPQCPWQAKHKSVPALVIALRAIAGGELVSVLRIRLDQRKRWPRAARRILGPAHGVAAMFDEPIRGKLTIGVNVETCLLARQLGLGPVWAVCNVRTIAAFPLVSDVTELTILGEPGSLDAIEMCVSRWRKAGRRVRVAIPEAADHFDNELLRSE
jgi:hypothetical protein